MDEGEPADLAQTKTGAHKKGEEGREGGRGCVPSKAATGHAAAQHARHLHGLHD